MTETVHLECENPTPQQQIRRNAQTRNELIGCSTPTQFIANLCTAKRDSRVIFVRYGVRYGEDANELEQMRTINSNLFQTHTLQQVNSRTFEKSLAWRVS
jgi:hypothetical protein